MGWIIAIVVLPLVFVIAATWAILRAAILLVRLAFLPVQLVLRRRY
jgi:hypothetical protein